MPFWLYGQRMLKSAVLDSYPRTPDISPLLYHTRRWKGRQRTPCHNQGICIHKPAWTTLLHIDLYHIPFDSAFSILIPATPLFKEKTPPCEMS